MPLGNGATEDVLSDLMGEKKYDLQSANERLDGALDRLERQLHETKQRLAKSNRLEEQVANLSRERTELSQNLAQTNARANEIEASAKQVSKRIMGAMEKVQLALNGEAES